MWYLVQEANTGKLVLGPLPDQKFAIMVADHFRKLVKKEEEGTTMKPRHYQVVACEVVYVTSTLEDVLTDPD